MRPPKTSTQRLIDRKWGPREYESPRDFRFKLCGYNQTQTTPVRSLKRETNRRPGRDFFQSGGLYAVFHLHNPLPDINLAQKMRFNTFWGYFKHFFPQKHVDHVSSFLRRTIHNSNSKMFEEQIRKYWRLKSWCEWMYSSIFIKTNNLINLNNLILMFLLCCFGLSVSRWVKVGNGVHLNSDERTQFYQNKNHNKQKMQNSSIFSYVYSIQLQYQHKQ